VGEECGWFKRSRAAFRAEVSNCVAPGSPLVVVGRIVFDVREGPAREMGGAGCLYVLSSGRLCAVHGAEGLGFVFVSALGAEVFAVELAEGDAGAFERLRVTRGGTVDLVGTPKREALAMVEDENECRERENEDNTNERRVCWYQENCRERN
jgi:hypothetical protein